ncbi:unnamed protein product [Bursaphelenchus xylophilus]|uniref:(pine wood nematode) hypothetical protein n=1 Tax=Bursaphelenchus xylophilus TaxID=6326 RepID=A0A1I7RVQ5_BURXY|nr:unnamed protein product [Bursaphelenchus xylophilus]CAG9082008.1 unnamed protein product [Bursaphelenchus xylophilus]
MNGRKKPSSSSTREYKDGAPLPVCGDKEWEVAEPAKPVEHINEALTQSKVNVFVAGAKSENSARLKPKLGMISPTSVDKLSKRTTSSSATRNFSPSLVSVRRQKNPPIINEVPIQRIPKKNQFLDEKFVDSTTLFDEVMEVLREVLAEFEDQVEVINVKSILEETPQPVENTDPMFYMAYKTSHTQDHRGGFVIGFETDSQLGSSTPGSASISSRRD